ncbi:hypothetical protein TEA_003405 [Camellia sinensis var. sinensis]|uniref:Uncharacterized protein n=1 Tax=Camellia sinensis var. sinensis TaxID=542762 RepID=A0A4S4DJU1_CAMSN|nr:hypothetical protein TEA_003405 [Camellia sinensis var. sinensis]
MENQIGAFEDGGGGGGPYQSLPANDDIVAVASSSDDAHRLKQLGYKQELSRSLSYFKQKELYLFVIHISSLTMESGGGATVFGWIFLNILGKQPQETLLYLPFPFLFSSSSPYGASASRKLRQDKVQPLP